MMTFKKTTLLLIVIVNSSLFAKEQPNKSNIFVQKAVHEPEAINDPEKLIRSIGEAVIYIVKDDQTSYEDKRQKLKKIMQNTFALKPISRFVLARHWRRTSPEQQKAYLASFTEAMSEQYTSKFTAYHNEKFEVQKDRGYEESDGAYIVRSQVSQRNGTPIKVDWKLYQSSKNGWKVFDVYIEGVSMSLSLRNEHGTIIREKGIDGLIQHLRHQKTS